MASRRHRRSSGAASAAPERSAGDRGELDRLVASLPDLDKPRLLLGWRNHLGGTAPAHLPSWLLARLLAFRLPNAGVRRCQRRDPSQCAARAGERESNSSVPPFANRSPATRDGVDLKPGAMLAREWRGRLDGSRCLKRVFAWNGKTYSSLSQVAKAIAGTSWNGHRFFGLRSGSSAAKGGDAIESARATGPTFVRPPFGGGAVKPAGRKANCRCAIYTRVSSDSGPRAGVQLVDNQREASSNLRPMRMEARRAVHRGVRQGAFLAGSPIRRPCRLHRHDRDRRGANRAVDPSEPLSLAFSGPGPGFLITSGPVMNMWLVPSTMRVKSVMAGE